MDQDDVVVFPIYIALNDFFIKCIQKGIVRKAAVPQLQKPGLCAVRHLLIQGKFQVQKIFPKSSGQRFAENIKILEHLLFRKGEKRFLKLRADLFFCIYITPADPGDGAVFVCKLFSDLQSFFLIHRFLPFFVIWTAKGCLTHYNTNREKKRFFDEVS